MSNCEICGQPMPKGEEMFKFHGFSGRCPAPPLCAKTEVVAEYIFRDMTSGEYWIDIRINRKPYCSLGPFDRPAERQRVHDDLISMTRQLGAKDLPPYVQ
jgi:hypothetical protein